MIRKFLVPGLLALALAPFGAAHAVEVGLNVAPRQFREDGAAPRGRLFRTGRSLPALTVQLRSTDARVVVPATVSFAEGERQLFFPIRLANDSIVNFPGSRDGFRPFQIQIGGAGIATTIIDLKILDDEPFRAPVLSKVVLSRFESVEGTNNQVRLVFSAPVSFNRNRFGQPSYGLSINGRQVRAVGLQFVSSQVLVIVLDRAFRAVDTLAVVARNLVDTRGLPLPDQNRVVVAGSGQAFTLTLASTVVFENGGSQATRGVIRLAKPAPRDITFRVSSQDRDRNPKLQVLAPVVVRAGQTSATFDVAVTDNLLADGDQFELLRAAPVGNPFNAKEVLVAVIDDETALPASDVRLASISVVESSEFGKAARLRFSAPIAANYNGNVFYTIVAGNRSYPPIDLGGFISGDALSVDLGLPRDLPRGVPITITARGLRDAQGKLVPPTSITFTLPSVPRA